MSRVSQASSDARKVIIAVNPKAGAKSGQPMVDKLVEQLHSRDFCVDVLTSQETIAAHSREWLAAGTLRALVCAGGDGTVAFAANVTPLGTPLAILPLGTENLLAKYFGIRADPVVVADVIEQGWICRIDAGMAGERLFTLMAGLGFDADVVRRVHENRTGHIRHLSYAKPIWSAIRTYKYPELRVYCEGVEGEEVEQPIRARWVFVANLPRYAGNLQIIPEADGTDGLIDVCTFKQGSLWKGLQYLMAVLMNRHRRWRSDVQYVRATRVRIEADEPVSYQLDGDFGGHLPLEIKVLAERLTMLVPHAWLDQAGLAEALA